MNNWILLTNFDIFLQDLCSLVAEFCSVATMMRSSRNLEIKMLKSIIHSTMQFYESTPIGRIINRFSKDLYSVEFILPLSLKDFGYTIFDLTATVIIISISTPLFASILIPMFLLYFAIQVSTLFQMQYKHSCILIVLKYQREYMLSVAVS